MKRRSSKFSRRRFLSVGTIGVGAFGVYRGTRMLVSPHAVRRNRTTVAQSTEGGVDLRVHWGERYNGQLLEDGIGDTDPGSNGPIVELPNVMPGDRGTLSFELEVGRSEDDVQSAEFEMRLTDLGNAENGRTEPELVAGDDTPDVGELHEYLELSTWVDSLFCDGFQGTIGELGESSIDDLTGTLKAVSVPPDSSDTWTRLGCSNYEDQSDTVTLCVGLRWSLPEDLPGVDDNIVQSDSAAFGIEFGSRGQESSCE